MYLITWSYPVDDVFKVDDHLFIPEVSWECFCPFCQQLQDFGTKLAHLCLLLKKSKRFTTVLCIMRKHGTLACKTKQRHDAQVCLNASDTPAH